MAKDVEHLFMHFFVFQISFLMEHLSKLFPIFKNEIFLLLNFLMLFSKFYLI